MIADRPCWHGPYCSGNGPTCHEAEPVEPSPVEEAEVPWARRWRTWVQP